MRLFIAIDLSEEQKRQIEALQRRLAGFLDGVRWIRPDGLHLTLVFMGEVEERRLPGIVQAMAAAAASADPFTLRFGKAGVFPAPSRARVLWIGVTEGAARASGIAAALGEGLAAGGLNLEKREYLPHLTLGRPSRPPPRPHIEKILVEERSFATGPHTAGSMTLYRSELTPRGAVYTVLQEIFFGGKGRKILPGKE